VWEGIIVSSWAGEKGRAGRAGPRQAGQGAVRAAAIQIDGKALDGSAYNSLGVLYYKVPGWPLGLATRPRRAELLQKALALNPQGIDANFFFAEYLVETGMPRGPALPGAGPAGAGRVPGRQVADSGRREEARALLAKIKSN
jgi:hypothetical protein